MTRSTRASSSVSIEPVSALSTRGLLVHEELELAARDCPDRIFCSFIGDTEFSFLTLYIAACERAGALRDIGIERGDRIAFMLGNCPAFVEMWYATSIVGGVAVPLNTALRLAIELPVPPLNLPLTVRVV